MLKTMGTSGYRARKGGHRSGESEPLGRPPSLGGRCRPAVLPHRGNRPRRRRRRGAARRVLTTVPSGSGRTRRHAVPQAPCAASTRAASRSAWGWPHRRGMTVGG